MYPKVNHGEEQSYVGINYNTSVELKKKKTSTLSFRSVPSTSRIYPSLDET